MVCQLSVYLKQLDQAVLGFASLRELLADVAQIVALFVVLKIVRRDLVTSNSGRHSERSVDREVKTTG